MAYFRSERYSPVVYHRELGFPKGTYSHVDRQVGDLPSVIKGGRHYAERCAEKVLPSTVTREWVRQALLIETQVVDGLVHRVLFRGPHSATRDLCVVIDTLGKCLVTGWTNDRRDWHRLDSKQSMRYTPVDNGE